METSVHEFEIVASEFGNQKILYHSLKGVCDNDVEKSYSLACSGLISWKAGRILCDYIISKYFEDIVNSFGPGMIHCLELGCGLGITGILLRKVFPMISITFTDGDIEACNMTEKNCVLNDLIINNRKDNNIFTCIEMLRWGNTTTLSNFLKSVPPCDIIIAGDVLYQEYQLIPLFETVSLTLQVSNSKKSKFILSFTRRGFTLQTVLEVAKSFMLNSFVQDFGCFDIFGEECYYKSDLLSNCIVVFELGDSL